MKLLSKLRRGEGPWWGRLKRAARVVSTFHMPVNRATRPMFRALYFLHVGGCEGLTWARRFFWSEPLFRSLCERIGERFRMEELPYVRGDGRILLGEDVRLSGKSSVHFGRSIVGRPELQIGDGTFVGHGCGFNVSRSVRVGRHCLLATGVQIYDADGHPLDAARRRAGEPAPPEAVAAVEIGDDVWVGAGAIILKGVNIGDRAIIGARAVVTKNVPADAVVVGNPARVLATRPVAPHPDDEMANP